MVVVAAVAISRRRNSVPAAVELVVMAADRAAIRLRVSMVLAEAAAVPVKGVTENPRFFFRGKAFKQD